MTKKKFSISGFFPFLNDWGTIGSLTATLDSVLKKHTSMYEIIIVDDGSDKKSKGVLKILKDKFPRVRLITHKQNKGYGAALKSGIKAAKMDWIFYTDGDAQYDPRELELLLNKLKDGVDIVNGYKIKRADPWYRTMLGKGYHHFSKLLFDLPVRDVDCDFRLMRRKIFDQVILESNSGVICVEMIKKIHDFGYKFQEVPVTHYWRTSGKSQFFNIRRVGQVIYRLLLLWYKLVIKKSHLKNANYTNQPAKV